MVDRLGTICTMRIVKPNRIAEYIEAHRDTESALTQWLAIAQAADWKSIADVRLVFPHADAATVASGSQVTIFNIKGNHYRLIVAVHYSTSIVYVRDFMTHAEYSKNRWKDRH